MQTNTLLKLKAHSLLSAIVISIIISIIIGSMLLLHYHNNIEWAKFKSSERLQRNMQSSINLVTGDSTGYNVIGEEQLDLFGNNEDSVLITKAYWGIFNLASVKSFQKNKSISKQFFYGIELSDTLSACLFLVDHQRPLQISGKTRLAGDAYLPKGGIKAAGIDGKQYEGKDLVYGQVLKSDTAFPAVNDYLVKLLYNNFEITRNKSFQNEHANKIQDSACNSFENEIQYFFINKENQLSIQKIKGKLVLFSDSLIEIKAGVKLEDVIIMAPEIYVADNFEGTVQLIASKIITLGKHCILKYPSSVILLKDSLNNYQGEIEIGENSFVSGLLFANATRTDKNKNSVALKKGASFEGTVFVHGFLQMEGMVYGTVLTDYFLYKSVVATYENSLVDAVIDRTKLHPDFISSTLIKIPGKLNIIKWLK